MIPRFNAALPGPLQDVDARILENGTTVERRLRGHGQAHTPPGGGSNCSCTDDANVRLAPAAASIELERPAPAE